MANGPARSRSSPAAGGKRTATESLLAEFQQQQLQFQHDLHQQQQSYMSKKQTIMGEHFQKTVDLVSSVQSTLSESVSKVEGR
eukprot:544833-Karenia_brevis.AAC.1